MARESLLKGQIEKEGVWGVIRRGKEYDKIIIVGLGCMKGKKEKDFGTASMRTGGNQVDKENFLYLWIK